MDITNAVQTLPQSTNTLFRADSDLMHPIGALVTGVVAGAR